MEWQGIVTVVVAVYGAALTTYTIILKRRERERQVTLAISQGFRVQGPYMSVPLLFINLANPGHKTVTLNTPCIRLPDGKSIVFFAPMSDVTFPHELGEGKSCKVWIDMRELAREIISAGHNGKVKLLAEVDDMTGKRFKSKKPFKLNVTEWAR